MLLPHAVVSPGAVVSYRGAANPWDLSFPKRELRLLDRSCRSLSGICDSLMGSVVPYPGFVIPERDLSFLPWEL